VADIKDHIKMDSNTQQHAMVSARALICVHVHEHQVNGSGVLNYGHPIIDRYVIVGQRQASRFPLLKSFC